MIYKQNTFLGIYCKKLGQATECFCIQNIFIEFDAISCCSQGSNFIFRAKIQIKSCIFNFNWMWELPCSSSSFSEWLFSAIQLKSIFREVCKSWVISTNSFVWIFTKVLHGKVIKKLWIPKVTCVMTQRIHYINGIIQSIFYFSDSEACRI
jgi:hypothetical protein